MNNTVNEITCLEMFPIELFTAIFEFLPVQELYKAFVGLNYRIDSIIQSMFNMSLTISPNFTTLKHIFQPHQFVRLVIPICAPKKLILACFSPQLRSLTITHPTSHQIEDIHPRHFPFLGYLNIQGPSALLCHFIFSNQFPCLSKISLIYVDISLEWSQSPSIRFVNLFSDSSAFTRVIEACPNMHTFIYKGGSIPFDYTLIQSHLALKHLSLAINYCPLFDKDGSLDILFTLLPNLVKISLSAFHLNRNVAFDFVSLAEILRRCLPQLAHFNANILGCPPLSDSVGHLHPLFRHVVHLDSNMIISSHQTHLKK